MIEGQQFPTYLITPLDLSDVQLRSGRILEKRKPSVIIQEQDNSEEDYLRENKILEEDTSFQDPNIEKPKQKEPIISTPVLEQTSTSTPTPPFPEILQIDRGVEKQIMVPNYDFLDELRNVCIKIPLLQAIKEIPILAKTIKDLSMKKTRKIIREKKKIQPAGKIADIMMGKITIPKYLDPGNLVVKIHINGIEI